MRGGERSLRFANVRGSVNRAPRPSTGCMGFLSELRYPTKWYSKLIMAALAVAFFSLLTTATVSGFLLYRIVSPVQSRGEINTKDFPGHPGDVTFDVPGMGRREGWFFPGLRSAPTIILCHGYQSNRGELLTLVTALQDNQYNVFVFDFDAHSASHGLTTFGFRETQELRAAIATVAQRDDVDRERLGLWGANLGGYTAIAVAAGDPRVRALAVDSVYDRPVEMLRLQFERSGLSPIPLMRGSVELGFQWLNSSYRHEPPLSARLPRLAGVPKLYIMGSDEPQLAQSTSELFRGSPEPREQVLLAHGNYVGMRDDEKRIYENRIASFFLLNLPPSGRPRR